ncbi:hypothetical protein D3C85_1620600 [compost metagenome]
MGVVPHEAIMIRAILISEDQAARNRAFQYFRFDVPWPIDKDNLFASVLLE